MAQQVLEGLSTDALMNETAFAGQTAYENELVANFTQWLEEEGLEAPPGYL